MPSIFIPIDHKLGACLQVRVGPHSLKALVDTGAETTTIDRDVAAMLDLQKLENTELKTPGGAVQSVVYQAPLTLIHPDMSMTVEKTRFVEGDLKGQDLDLILGRDVLSRCVVIWNGPLRAATISF